MCDLCGLVRSDCTAKVKDVVILEGIGDYSPTPFPKETGCEGLQNLIYPTRKSKSEPPLNVEKKGKQQNK